MEVVPPFLVGGRIQLEEGVGLPHKAGAPKGALSPLVADLSLPSNLYILEDFHPMDIQVFWMPLLVDLVLVGPGLIRASPSHL